MRNSHSSIHVESLFDTDRYMYEKYPPPPILLFNEQEYMRGNGGGGGPKMWHGAGGGVEEYISINRGQKPCSSMQKG
jgi:hypothetical protein